MKEVKEPEITLFGRKILLPDNTGELTGGEDSDEGDGGSGGAAVCEVSGREGEGDKAENDDELDHVEELCKTKDPARSKESQNPTVSSELDENPKTSSNEEDTASENNPKSENEQSDAAANRQQKPLKKPDKILPCPRCNSMDTKFCYYNNYNVNQPRHFCKSCQRYWTAGGTMRNVPVGAGRRKNKNSASHCRHITISEALQAARIDPPNGFHHHSGFKPNGTVLSFGPDSPLCESIASALNLAEKRAPNGVRNGCLSVDNAGLVSCKKGEVKEDSSIGSSSIITSSSSVAKQGENCVQQPVMHGLNYPVPCIPGVGWPFPWNSALPLLPMMPFYPTPYWNCGGVPNAWNVAQWGNTSSPNSPLGKHSRNGELLKPEGSKGEPESSTVVPKTLRMDDPEEAAKSSIWETLGIKHDSVRRGGLFKALQPKSERKVVTTTASALQANPAALSRSITFRESAA